MEWYRFCQKKDAEEAEEPAQDGAGQGVPPPAPANMIAPKNRTEQDKALKGMFRDIGWKSPEIMKTVQKAPGMIWPLMQGIDQVVSKRPGTMERAKDYFKKKDLEIPAPPGAKLDGVRPTVPAAPPAAKTRRRKA